MSTLIDTNILIDLLGTGPVFEGSVDAVLRQADAGPIVIGAVVWAELATSAVQEEQLMRRLAWLRPRREPFPFEAAYAAGLAHWSYRDRGGQRERTLPDFLIGAHALVAGHRLLTRDPKRYRAYFPTLDLTSPESHS
ncbi:hypothetical protein ASG43_01675 [Aureimonas sp. Leaf454]|uniref:type II toxin-antitoxin system VapC family toxin n=1 Tax=Aureimonas sp. Leaf454 TaxID=1736381 RepID=UPI0006F7B78C|nr:type II toxin-antitoxin system VapC family toxin [Aureimonas sp. Leaf454]KQT54344.1 hypothetical protein ASG43_01675 [Aureimonas sp. Leaf454]